MQVIQLQCHSQSATECNSVNEKVPILSARYGTETHLLLILRSLIVSTNRQKIQRALETDAQIQMEQLVRELLSVSRARLKMRHQHLQILQISMCLSSYAAMWLPEYGEIFDVFAPEFRDAKNIHLRHFYIIVPPLVRKLFLIPPNLFHLFLGRMVTKKTQLLSLKVMVIYFLQR